MGQKKSTGKSTSVKEPQIAAVPKVPQFGAILAETAWQIAIPFMGFVLLGNWLDGRNESEPVFVLVGLGLAVTSTYIIVKRLVGKHYPDTFKKQDG